MTFFEVSNFLSPSPKSESSGSFTHNVVLSAPSTQPVTVTVEFSVPSIYGQDASIQQKTITFQPGETAKPITVNITDDAIYEAEELIAIDIISATNATVDIGGPGIPNNSLFFTIAESDPTSTKPVADDDTASTQEDKPVTILVSTLLDGDTDQDGDQLTITTVAASNGGTVTLDGRGTPASSDDIVIFTPSANFNGAAGFNYTLSDDDGNLATGRVTVDVATVNDAPTTSVPIINQVIAEDAPWNFAPPAGTFTDVDGDALTLTATQADGSALPSWLAFNSTTRTFVGAPPQNYNGTVALKVAASDGALSTATTFTLTISPVNDAPVTASAIADQTTPEDTTWSFALPAGTFTDVDGDALACSATLGNGSALPSWLTFNAATRTFTGTPPANFAGGLALKVTASDGTLSAADTFDLTVSPINDAPAIIDGVSNTVVLEDQSWTYQVPAGAFEDVDGDALAFSATLADGSALPAWLAFNGATRTFSGTPPQSYNGAVSLKVTASDGALSASSNFTLAVTPVNDAPVVADGTSNTIILEEQDWTHQVPAGTFTDVDGDALRVLLHLQELPRHPTDRL